MTAARTAVQRPIVRRSLDVRAGRDGNLYVLRGPGKQDLLLDAAPAWLPRLLQLADGTRDVRALAHELRSRGLPGDSAEIADGVAALAEVGILDDAAGHEPLPAHARQRYDRQLACFADYTGDAASAGAGQAALLDATVCLLGLGGLGSWAAWGLACAGVGAVVGVDCDRLELSNLNRQVLYSEEDLGRPKADAAGGALTRFNAQLRYTAVRERLESAEDVRRVIAGADFVLDSLDSPAQLITRWVSQACFERRIPLLSMSQHPPQVRVGPLYVPGRTGCFACQEESYRDRYPLYGQLEESEQIVQPSATFGPACGVVGTLAANEAVAYLAGLHEPTTLASALVYDLRTASIEREQVVQREGCPVCSGCEPRDGR